MKLISNGNQIAYEFVDGNGPCVIFCPGFNSTMQGNKAQELRAFCIEQGRPYIRFDYSGHGESGGDFADCCISTWLDDTLAVIDNIAAQETVLVGSSMGGWIALLAALKRANRVKGLLLIACAADMTKFYPNRLQGLTANRDSLGRTFYSVENEYDDKQPYSIYQKLIDDGCSHYLLDAPIELDIPIQLVHGKRDEVIEWQRSELLLNRLTSSDVNLLTLESGDHRLSTPENLQSIRSLLMDILRIVE